MSKFEAALDYVISNEGSIYENDPRDSGGCTKFGITLRTALSYPLVGIRNCEDVKNMTRQTASTIYYALFWKYELVDDSRVAAKMFDLAVNIGPSANLLFQRACGTCGHGVRVDGIFGPKTINAINACDPNTYLNALVVEAKLYYDRVVEHRPKDNVFLKGWKARAEKLPQDTEAV